MPVTHKENSFETISSEIAKNFLQTVMIVDDQAYYVEEEKYTLPNPNNSKSKRLKKPTGIRVGRQVDEKQINTDSETVNDDDVKEAEHRLNAKILTDSFADMGIACTVIRPIDTKESHLDDRIIKLAKKSDIIILDWILSGDDSEGKKTSEIISRITKSSTKINRKSRLITVYTGNSDLEVVLNTLEQELENEELIPVKDTENLTITVDSVRITILAKKYAQIPEGSHFYDRKIGEKDIPKRLIKDFTEMTSGLVSNAVLKSFATIRENTHHILAKFHLDLDAPFLAHRLMLPHPSDANEHLSNLIGTEITALLEGKMVGGFTDTLSLSGRNYSPLNEWLIQFKDNNKDWYKDWNKMVLEGKATKHRIVKTVYDLLCEDGSPEKKLREYLVKKSISKERKKEVIRATSSVHTLEVTKRFINDEEKAEVLDKEFAFLTTVNSFYKEKPFLRFGTILKETTNPQRSKYWLCVQPLCDCVRIPGRRKFPFLKMETYNDRRHKTFDLVFMDEDYVCASVVYKTFESEFIKFRPNDKKVISSQKREEGFIFSAIPEGNNVARTFKWLGDLKFPQAQRVANQYAANMSRVGLDESEWLRRWSTIGKLAN